jgi:hypothetical protein
MATRGPGSGPSGATAAATAATSALETPAVQTPAVQTPAVQKPAVQNPAVQKPAVQKPAGPAAGDGGSSAAPWSPLTAGEELTGAADPHPRSRPFGMVDDRYQARFALVRRLLWVLAGVLVGGVGMLVSTRWTRLTADDVSDFVTMVFGAMVALVGCGVGFYFGGDGQRD